MNKYNGFMIVAKDNSEIGAGERNKKYIYWDEEEAQAFIDKYGYITFPGDMGWKVVPVVIEITN